MTRDACSRFSKLTNWKAAPRACCFAWAAAVLNLALSATSCCAESPTGASAEFFEKKVRPLLVEKCHRCHGPAMQKGGLRLDSREGLLKGGESGPVVNPGHPEKSELVRAINYEADGFQMPPTGKLDAESIGALTEWVRQGAPWPEHSAVGASKASAGMDFAQRARHWSFQPLSTSVPPRIAEPTWPRNPVDAFLSSRLEGAGCRHANLADRRTLLRRITFDLIGLPPTPDEIHAFLQDDSPRAYEKVVDRLLASPHYGVRWGRHWLDLVRYAETLGHEFDYPIAEAWRYRDYVVRALNDDVPYDQFVTEHIAGDLISNPRRKLRDGTNESVIGTAFWWFGQGVHSPVDLRVEECDRLDNQIDVMGKAFLGLSIACARCHDHKFDPIRAQDYYALTGFLRSSRQQLAFLDDPHPIDEFTRWRDACGPRYHELVEGVLSPHSWSEGAEDDEILRPWRELKSVQAGAPFRARRKKLAGEMNRRNDLAGIQEDRNSRFDDFRSSSFGVWNASGAAFGNRPSRAGDLVVTPAEHPRLEFAEPESAHSGLLSPKLKGALRSPSFTIEKPFIHYRATRHGADSGPERPYKSGQLNLVVDGFQIIREPLYGQLSLAVANDAPASWYTQRVAKLIGSRAYIEILDEDDGWISVDAIRFSDDATPPVDRPNELVQALLNDSSIDSYAKLTAAYEKLFTETVTSWKSGRLTDDRFAKARIAVLNSRCRHLVPQDSPAGRQLVGLLDDFSRRESTFPSGARVVALADGSGENDRVLIRGNPKKAGDEVPRRFLEVFEGAPIPTTAAGSGRLELAQALTGRAAPLVARVIVNRLWHHHFGRGIVPSTDDFGKMGEAPSHPELLDYLAGELIRSGWSIKHVQRLLVTSAAYQMSSGEPDARAATLDPENRLLHRARTKRLEAETIRDSILAVSGRLKEQLEGPSVNVHLDDFMTGRGRPAGSGPLDGDGRRSIYLEVRRNFLSPLFLAFDFPIPATTAGRRAQSNVPAQALSLLNHPFVAQQAHICAKRILSERSQAPSSLAVPDDRRHSDGNGDDRLSRLYETAFARLPSSEERQLAKEFLRSATSIGQSGNERAWDELCHVLLNVKEFLYVN
jgi:hypothetical protein